VQSKEYSSTQSVDAIGRRNRGATIAPRPLLGGISLDAALQWWRHSAQY
jgi:hypothetical protein